jgi:hypothetical protein
MGYVNGHGFVRRRSRDTLINIIFVTIVLLEIYTMSSKLADLASSYMSSSNTNGGNIMTIGQVARPRSMGVQTLFALQADFRHLSISEIIQYAIDLCDIDVRNTDKDCSDTVSPDVFCQ